MSKGIVYIATGSEFVQEALISAERATKVMPDIPVTLMTDVNTDSPVFDEIISIENPEYGFEDQILNMHRSPYDRSIYLDTDTYVYEDISDLFDLLESFDLGLAHSSSRVAWDVEGVPDSFPEYNSGVIAYRNDSDFQDFLSEWEQAYFDEKESDETMRNQPSLRKTLFESELRIATLPPEYNCMYRYPGYAVGTVKVFHGRLQDLDGPGAGDYFDTETAVEVINRTEDPRVFTQLGGITLHTNKTDSLFHRARLSYRKHGLKHVVVESIKLIRDKI